MKKLTGLLIIIIITVFLSTGCKNKQTGEQILSVKTDSVGVFHLQKENITKEISFPGELLALERAEIFAKISGYLKDIKVDIGDAVKKGQVIAILDAPEMIAGYSQVNSEVQMSKSRFAGSLDAYNRIANAAKVDGTVSAGELERMKSQMMADSAALESAKSRLNAYSQLKDYLVIRSPLNGIVTQRNMDPGTLVGTGNTKPVLVIENNTILRLRLPVPEAFTSANPEGESVHFTVDAYPGVVYDAKLSRKSGAINQSNRTESWEFIYPNKGNQLKSGMYANASIKFGRSSPSFVVPATAIVTNLEKRFVIRLKNGKTEWVDVRNGFVVDNRTEIFGDLSEGDTILLRGTDEIKPGIEFIPKFQEIRKLAN